MEYVAVAGPLATVAFLLLWALAGIGMPRSIPLCARYVPRYVEGVSGGIAPGRDRPMTIRIDEYTGQYQEALRPSPPGVGTAVDIYDSADDREYDDMKRCVWRAGLSLHWVEALDGGCNRYVVRYGRSDEEDRGW